MQSDFISDDFTRYQHIPLVEDEDFQLNYCMPAEVRCLARLIKACDAKTVLEIGTQAGMTTCYLSKNLPPDGVLYTIDISKDMHAAAEVVDGQRPEILDREQVGWYYRARGCDSVVQIIGDSRYFGYREVGIREIGLCFIDGNHTLDAVYLDVMNVLQYMREGCCLVWHDFEGVSSADVDVKGALSKLLSDGVLRPPIYSILGTRMAYTIL